MLLSITDELDAAASAPDALFDAANEMVHAADRIKEAVGAPFRPAWADPAVTARELAAREGSLFRRAAARIRELEAKLSERPE